MHACDLLIHIRELHVRRLINFITLYIVKKIEVIKTQNLLLILRKIDP
jgi:hypothetical protein